MNINLSQECDVRDMFAQKALPTALGNVSAVVPPHDIVALRLTCPSTKKAAAKTII